MLCATADAHTGFRQRIGRPGGDPQDVLVTVEAQLAWVPDASPTQVDCYWRWRGFPSG